MIKYEEENKNIYASKTKIEQKGTLYSLSYIAKFEVPFL